MTMYKITTLFQYYREYNINASYNQYAQKSGELDDIDVALGGL